MSQVSIIGSGPIGALTALVSAKAGAHVNLFDVSFQKKKQEKDGRFVSLGKAQALWLKSFGIELEYESPINAVNVRESLSTKTVTFFNNPPIGFMVPHAEIANKILEQAEKHKNIKFCQEKIELINLDKTKNEVSVIANGANYEGPKFWKKQATQAAICFNFEHEFEHDCTAIEAFFEDMAIASLPLKDKNKSACVMIVPIKKKDFMQNLDEEEVKKIMLARFPHLGIIKKSSKSLGYDLNRSIAWPPTFEGWGIIGDAAHKLHPIAGQGLNLGLRDVRIFQEMLEEKINLGEGFENFWQDYSKKRKADLAAIFATTEGSLKLFSLPISPLRKIGMQILDNFGPLKNLIQFKAMGF